MKNLPVRTWLYIGFFFIISGFYTIINPIFTSIYIMFLGLIMIIVTFFISFTGVFNFIENVSSLKYLEIRPDNYSNTKFQKFINFIYSYIYILFFNFLISVSSIYLIYKTDSFSREPALILSVSMTIVLLIRFLAYFKNDVAKEIGKTFRYAMFPLGLTIFIWDLILLNKNNSSQSIYSDIIIDNGATIVALLMILVAITSLEPLFELLNKFIICLNSKNEKLSEMIVSKAEKMFQKQSR